MANLMCYYEQNKHLRYHSQPSTVHFVEARNVGDLADAVVSVIFVCQQSWQKLAESDTLPCQQQTHSATIVAAIWIT